MELIPVIISIFSLVVAIWALTYKRTSTKTNVDDNVINYMRIIIELIEKLPDMDENSKAVIKSLILRMELPDDKELEEFFMSL